MHTYTFKIGDGDGYEAVIAISGLINLSESGQAPVQYPNWEDEDD